MTEETQEQPIVKQWLRHMDGRLWMSVQIHGAARHRQMGQSWPMAGKSPPLKSYYV